MTTKRKTAKPTTALALARRVERLERVRPKKTKADAPPPSETPVVSTKLGSLEDTIELWNFGVSEIKLTEKEDAILSRPVRPEDVRVLPSGIVYLPHMVYTRWLCEAFGRTGWALRPLSKPSTSMGGQVIVPYHLMVHGTPVAFCYGEQDYHEKNRQQSYGDALEATHASALRRLCKRLNIGLELWDKEFNDQFLEEHCVEVPVEIHQKQADGTWKTKVEHQWRLKNGRPLRGEKRGGQQQQQQRKAPPAPEVGEFQERERAKDVTPVSSHAHADQPITEKQAMRLWTIARKRGRTDDEVKRYLSRQGFASSKAIPRSKYESIVAAIEHPGDLPAGGTGRREPGMEG